MEERRRQPRLEQWLPVQIGGAHQALGVAHNASRHGMLMMATHAFDVGDQLELTIQNPKTGATLTIPGKVVRVGANQGDPDGMWRHAVAIQFAEPEDALEELVQQLAGKSAE